MIVLASLVGDAPLTSAQATIIGVLMLVGHGLPVECAIARKSGARFLFQVVIRLVGAFVFAWLLHAIYSATGTLQGPATMLFTPDAGGDQTITAWIVAQAKNMLSIVLIIFSLLVMMRVLHAIRVIDLMNRILRPVLSLIGIGPKASAITVIGLTMGLSYGGGLIINEAKNGSVGKGGHLLFPDPHGTVPLPDRGQPAHHAHRRPHQRAFSGDASSSPLIAMAGIVQLVRRLPQKTQASYLWVEN